MKRKDSLYKDFVNVKLFMSWLRIIISYKVIHQQTSKLLELLNKQKNFSENNFYFVF